jgi:hypothetical protein
MLRQACLVLILAGVSGIRGCLGGAGDKRRLTKQPQDLISPRRRYFPGAFLKPPQSQAHSQLEQPLSFSGMGSITVKRPNLRPNILLFMDIFLPTAPLEKQAVVLGWAYTSRFMCGGIVKSDVLERFFELRKMGLQTGSHGLRNHPPTHHRLHYGS